MFVLNGCVELSSFPISLFGLPKLRELSLWKDSITIENVLKFNDIINMTDITDITDNITDKYIDNYFDNNFKWNPNADYYLSLNPICNDSIRHFLPITFQSFLNQTQACYYPCKPDSSVSFRSLFCPANLYGDGKCDYGCNVNHCLYDGGDCAQLCFQSSFSECTWDLFSNEKCDPECDNIYCSGYKWKSDFPAIHPNINPVYRTVNGIYGEYIADNQYFIKDPNNTELVSNLTCSQSIENNIYTECQYSWIGAGLCDDYFVVSCKMSF